jgi:acetyl esterase/lipase
LIQFAEREGAIVVTPDYRLIPEANGSDILADVKDFWDWVKESLPAKVLEISNAISLDLSRVAVGGESAGEYVTTRW